MFKLFTRKRQHIDQTRISPVDQAIEMFLDSLERQPYRNMAAARDAVAIARQRGVTRPVQIWAIYNDSIAYYV